MLDALTKVFLFPQDLGKIVTMLELMINNPRFPSMHTILQQNIPYNIYSCWIKPHLLKLWLWQMCEINYVASSRFVLPCQHEVFKQKINFLLQNFNYYFYDTFENFLNNNIEVHVLIANWKVFLMTYLKISF